jgi:hypothetical protein
MKISFALALAALAFLVGAGFSVLVFPGGLRSRDVGSDGASVSTHTLDRSAEPADQAFGNETSGRSGDVAERIALAINETDEARRFARLYAFIESNEVDPRTVVDAITRHPDYRGRINGGWEVPRVPMLIYGAWAKKDARAAAEHALALADPALRSHAVESVLRQWARTDLAEARQWVAACPDDDIRRGGELLMNRRMVESDPERAIDLILSGASAKRDDALVFGSWAVRDPQAAARRAASLPAGNFRNSAIQSVASSWADRDVAAAMAWVEQLPRTSNHTAIMQAVVRPWFHEDFDSAFKWLQSEQDESVRAQVSQDITHDLQSKGDYDAALAVAQFAPPQMQDHLLRGLAQGWVQHDPKAAQAWAESQTDPEVQAQIWPALAGSLARFDAPAAIRVATAIQDSTVRRHALRELVDAWSPSKPREAADWAVRLSDEDDRGVALGYAMKNWAEYDPAGATQWFSSSAPAGAGRDYAIRLFAPELLDSDPALAMKWAAAVGDPDNRDTQLSKIGFNWLLRDPAAARPWLDGAGLPDRVRRRIAEWIEKYADKPYHKTVIEMESKWR